ncbi:cell division protein FtsX [bacterium BMS3Abin04]|nr:cell division protein FtsX [bacterium BMS3Abin04]
MFLFLLSESFNSLFRAKFATLITIVTTSIAIFFVSLSIFLVLLSHQLDTKVKNRIQVNVFLADSLSKAQINDLRNNIMSDSLVKSIRMISKEEAKQIFISRTGKDFSSILSVNPLPVSFVLKLKPKNLTSRKIEKLTEKIKKTNGVDDVVYDYRLTIKLLYYIKSFRLFIYIGSLILVLISLYLVYSTNRLALNSKLELYETMKLVGTKLSTIKLPLLFNGIIIGIISAIITAGVFMIIIDFLKDIYSKLNVLNNKLDMLVIILAIGILLGLLGSYFSTRRISLKIK